uniref:Uncharacterized protein n=1 Tax=Oryza punctata TaxID=4537 RepID=A0A0E0KJU2_ORYPU
MRGVGLVALTHTLTGAARYGRTDAIERYTQMQMPGHGVYGPDACLPGRPGTSPARPDPDASARPPPPPGHHPPCQCTNGVKSELLYMTTLGTKGTYLFRSHRYNHQKR